MNVCFSWSIGDVNFLVGAFHDAALVLGKQFAAFYRSAATKDNQSQYGMRITKHIWGRNYQGEPKWQTIIAKFSFHKFFLSFLVSQGVTGNIEIGNDGDRINDYVVLHIDRKDGKFKVW